MRRIAKHAMALLIAALCGSTGCAYTIPGNVESLASLLSSLNGRSDITISADIAVTNMRASGRSESGFLNGTASAADLAAVEIAVGEGAYTEATGTAAWSWQLPTGPTGLRIDGTYTLNIRARDIAGNYSEPISFTITKGLNQDVNGDGYPDLVTSARNEAGGGRAYVFHGGAGGLDTKNASAADAILIGEGGGAFGLDNVLLADLNGDGFADAIVTDPQYSTNTGRAYIFYSRGSAGIASAGAGSADAIITGHTTSLLFGLRTNAGDINGDGYTDLAVGSTQGTGVVYLFQSAGSTGIATGLSTSATAAISHTAAESFGGKAALGDIDGDGIADLIAAARTADGINGRLYIFLSGGSALSSRTTAAADASVSGEGASRLGSGLIVRDLNGDGYGDILISGHEYNSSAGRAYLFYSAGASGIASGSVAAANLIITGDAASGFGRSLALGDIDGDGNMDLVVGSPDYPGGTEFGRAYVFYNINSLTSGNATTLAGTLLTGAIAGQSQANDVALLDMNADGFPDVLVGSNNNSTVIDEVHYFRAPGSGLMADRDLGSGGSADATLDGETVNSRFGQAIVR